MVVGPGDQVRVGDHGQPEHGVADHLSAGHPERYQVRIGLRHRIDAQQRPEEDEARCQQRQVGQLPHRHAMEPGHVPGREVQHERRDHQDHGRDRRERQHLCGLAADRAIQPRPGPGQRLDDQGQRPAEREEQRYQQEQQDRLHRAHVKQHRRVHGHPGHGGDDPEAEPDPAEHDAAAHRPRLAGPAHAPRPGQVEPAEQRRDRERPGIERPLGERPLRSQLRWPVVAGSERGTHHVHRGHAATLPCRG